MGNSAVSAAAPQVKLNDFERLWADAGADVVAAVRAVGESGWYILGREVEAFERDLARLWSSRFAVGVASGLDAIEIGLRACGCKAHDKVLLPPISAFATVLAVARLGAIPVFVDCDRFGLMDLDQAREALAAEPSIRFAVPVHLYGHAMDLDALAELKSHYGIAMVEDAAQSVGASFRGNPCGAAGDCAATSFYPTKNLGALGDGGALLTNSEQHATLARQLRDYGQSSKYVHERIGYNSRLDELHAAILRRAMLPRLGGWTAKRRAIAAHYIGAIRNPLLEIPSAPAESESCWHLFPVLVANGRKAEFLAHLSRNGIAAGEHYPSVLMDQPAMREIAYREFRPCFRARDSCAREVSLPIHPYLAAGEIDRVVEACNVWC